MRTSVRVFYYVLSAALIVATAEIGSLAAMMILRDVGPARFLFYEPPAFDPGEYAAYMGRRDPVLGWPGPGDRGGPRYDDSGSRHIPSFPRPGGECASLYGDSFTYSADVNHEDAWSNVLSRLLDCRVANFGVSGYGTDQAYLRFEINRSDSAPVTILGFYPWDVLRNLTRYQYLIDGTTPQSFKPRFTIENGKAVLIPIPQIDEGDLQAFGKAPGRFLDHETFLPDGRFGPRRIRFPYSVTLARAVLDERVVNVLRRRPSWENFLLADHDSGGCKITTAIMEKFVELCRRRDKRCFVVLFPTPSSYRHYKNTGESVLQNLIDSLKDAGIDYLHLTPGLSRYLGERSYCEILVDPEGCSGHHNPEGDRAVAELIREYMMSKSWSPGAAAADGSSPRAVGE